MSFLSLTTGQVQHRYANLFLGEAATPPPGPLWVLQNSAADSDWRGVAYSASLDLVVAVAQTGVDFMGSSDGGVTWFGIPVPANTTDWYAITWDTRLSLFVAVGANSGVNDVITSPDGVTWTLHSSGV